MTAKPNQTLQRNRSAVTAAASNPLLSATMQPPRQLRASLTFEALGRIHSTFPFRFDSSAAMVG